MSACLHLRATITFYEEKPSQYVLEGGEIVEVEEGFEPYPLTKIDVVCPDCSLNTSYEDWEATPEPLRTYCQRIYQREYGQPDLSPQHDLVPSAQEK